MHYLSLSGALAGNGSLGDAKFVVQQGLRIDPNNRALKFQLAAVLQAIDAPSGDAGIQLGSTERESRDGVLRQLADNVKCQAGKVFDGSGTCNDGPQK